MQTVITHLKRRDGKDYSEESVSSLSIKEREQSKRVSRQLKCPLDIYRMAFMEEDLDHVAALLHVGG